MHVKIYPYFISAAIVAEASAFFSWGLDPNLTGCSCAV